MLPTLGIDISKDSFHVELSLNGKLRHRKFSNRKEGFAELRVWLTKHKIAQVHACLEATGPYSEALALYLQRTGRPGNALQTLDEDRAILDRHFNSSAADVNSGRPLLPEANR